MKRYLISRSGGRVYAHVREDRSLTPLCHVVRHSPDGFETGYGGSGPADLALSILTDYAPAEAEQCYQAFKWKFVAARPLFEGESYEIPGDAIATWLAGNQRPPGDAGDQA